MILHDRFSPRRPSIEPLEQRIAPALLVTGANLLGGGGNPSTGEASIGGNSLTLVKVLSGEAIVWYDHGIEAISVGPNTSLDITGDVGAIIGNLTAAGKLSDSDNNAANGLDGDLLLANNIVGITTHPLSNEAGSIGAIITGGSVNNLNISGNLSGIFAGDGAWRAQSHVGGGGAVAVDAGVDVNPVLAGTQHVFTFLAGNSKTVASGATISNVKIGAAEELQMFAGSGFSGAPGKPGLAGGSITNITITSAFIDTGVAANTPSYFLYAGDGGHGTTGGAGGSVQKVVELSSTGVVEVLAGQGGSGVSGTGGAGGSIKGLEMESDSAAYTVHAGKGGAGSPGGAGGSVSNVNFSGDSPSSGIIVHAQFTGGNSDDILLVDSGSGNMVIERNNGNGSGFTPVIQDSVTLQNTIGPVGTTPVSATAVDVNGDGLPDIVVAYKNSTDLGVYINQGGGIFYTQSFTGSGGSYSGNSLDATTVPLPYAPSKITAGNFTGDNSADIAVLTNIGGQSALLTLAGDGTGKFALPLVTGSLQANAVDLTPAIIQGTGYDDLFVGFKSGAIDSLLANGSSTGSAFNVVNSGITVAGGIANIDYNPFNEELLALNGTGTAVTLYGSSSTGALTLASTLTLTTSPGIALVAHFVPELQTTAEPIDVLSTISSGARLDVWTFQGSAYAVSATTQSTEPLKNFVPLYEGSSNGVAALGGSLGHFAFSQSSKAFYDVSLPFSGKKVGIIAGDGGAAFDIAGHGAAKGGAGGVVSGMNMQAGDISVIAGNGGSSQSGPAGAGGLISDSPVLVTVTGTGVKAIIEADDSLLITAGSGGSASGVAKTATGGSGGAVTGLNLSLQSGNIQVDAGTGGSGGGGAGGAGGSVTGLKSVNHGGDLSVTAGNGGAALGAAGNGGLGGSILTLTHNLSLADETIESPYSVTLLAGSGGSSNAGAGGAGGAVGTVNLLLQPSNESVNNPTANTPTVHTSVDSTLSVVITAGNGGSGATGGAGGSLKSINSTSVFDQLVVLVGLTSTDTFSFPEVNPVTAQLTAGNGGGGTKGAGGAGGAVSGVVVTGISNYDPDTVPTQEPLVIISGNGGNGMTIGGAGGAITGVTSLNAKFATTNGLLGGEVLNFTELTGATVISGHGGAGGTVAGGVGGTISNLSIGIDGLIVASPLSSTGNTIFSGGELNIQSGAGGAGGATAKGGAAGSIASSVIGCADTYSDYGILLQGGVGGSGGAGGGAGGNVSNIQLNSPQNPMQQTGVKGTVDALSTLVIAGNGGAATGASAFGGLGGSISGITQSKDVNSSINLLQAGSGGASGAGTGGLGGSVTSVNTVGLIGQASDDSGNTFGAFQTNSTGYFNSLFPGGVPEGIFAGRGGVGKTLSSNGLAGSVMSINAAQISAIGAAVDATGLFAAAEKVANITAESIAYDVNGNGVYNNATGANLTNPGAAVAIDGFIFSKTMPVGVNTDNNTLLKAFTFVG